MQTREVLADAFGRIGRVVHEATAGLDEDQLAFRPDAEANSIGWLVWHLTRVQDRCVARTEGGQQLWRRWHAEFGMPDDPEDTGKGHSSQQAAQVRPSGPAPLLDYHEAVAAATLRYLAKVDADELDRVIDPSEPETTVGAQLVTAVAGCLQHAGQAAYVRGIVERRG